LASDLDAEDLAQETLAHAWRHLGELRDPALLLPWLRRALVRRGVRQARRERARGAWIHPDPAALEAVPAPASTAPAVDVTALLAALSPRQRAAFFLTEIDGLTAVEAARELGSTAATVRVHRLLARRRLRALIPGGSR
jgi:RNA polymerase sigma factor (sigma-70 family)